MGHPDRLVDVTPLVGVEIKVAGLRQIHRWGDPDTDHVPDEYMIQVQWYMNLLQAVRWDLAVLLGQQFRIYKIPPHGDLQGALYQIAKRFWEDHVLTNTPPPVDHTEGTRRMLAQLYPQNTLEIRGATDEDIILAADLRMARRELERFELMEARLKHQLMDRIGIADGITGPGFTITWKKSKDGEATNWQALATDLSARWTLDEMEKLLKIYTTPKHGVRRFLAKFADDTKEATSGDTHQ